MTAPFFARGDTATPVKASLTAVAINIGFKIVLMGPLAQVGLALATAIGAWVNLGLIIWFAARAGILGRRCAAEALARDAGGRGVVMAVGLYLAGEAGRRCWSRACRRFRDETALARARRDRRHSLRRADPAVARPRLAARFSRRKAAARAPSPRRINPSVTKENFRWHAAAASCRSRLKPKLFVPICGVRAISRRLRLRARDD